MSHTREGTRQLLVSQPGGTYIPIVSGQPSVVRDRERGREREEGQGTKKSDNKDEMCVVQLEYLVWKNA